jgi:hypothetical protein
MIVDIAQLRRIVEAARKGATIELVASTETILALLDELEGRRAPEAHWECQQRIDSLEEKLTAMTAARDEACAIAAMAESHSAVAGHKLERIAELRKVGT